MIEHILVPRNDNHFLLLRCDKEKDSANLWSEVKMSGSVIEANTDVIFGAALAAITRVVTPPI